MPVFCLQPVPSVHIPLSVSHRMIRPSQVTLNGLLVNIHGANASLLLKEFQKWHTVWILYEYGLFFNKVHEDVLIYNQKAVLSVIQWAPLPWGFFIFSCAHFTHIWTWRPSVSCILQLYLLLDGQFYCSHPTWVFPDSRESTCLYSTFSIVGLWHVIMHFLQVKSVSCVLLCIQWDNGVRSKLSFSQCPNSLIA